MLVKIYTSTKKTYDQMYVGYTVVGDKDQEYATNIIKVNEHNPISAQVYGVMSALCWVKNNKPLYCDVSEIKCYSNIDNNNKDILLNKLQENDYIKCFTNNISFAKINIKDSDRLYRLTQQIDWKIMRDKYNMVSQFNKLSGRE